MNAPLLLIVIDGFGLAPRGDGNAISSARTPVFDRIFAENPWTSLMASGLDVGLPAGIMGNSDVGHTNIGAGRVVPQDIVRIDEAISSGTFVDNETLCGAAQSAARRGGRLHLMGLYSPGNVHACDAHVRALVDLAAAYLPPERVYVHVFADGRDTPPRSADGYLAALSEHVSGKATLATVSGRYYAMDRDQRWERTGRAYRAIVGGEGLVAATATEAVAQAYGRDEGDEFIQPTVLEAVHGNGPLIRDGDAVTFWNFRADRARQMCAALVNPTFDGFDRGALRLTDVDLCSMTMYEETQTWPAAYAPQSPHDVLGDVWSRAGLRQLRIAETEKYAHVTYFFSGGREELLPGEERILIPSPRVATYDLQPEMSAPAITKRLVSEIESGSRDVIVLNLANPDMVGHTGDIPATVSAVEIVDGCVGRLVEAVRARGGIVSITADHGNAEQMFDLGTGQPHTAHTTNPVPLIVCGGPDGLRLAEGGRLADVAPTLLELTGLPQPAAMTGRSLIQHP